MNKTLIIMSMIIIIISIILMRNINLEKDLNIPNDLKEETEEIKVKTKIVKTPSIDLCSRLGYEIYNETHCMAK